MVTILTIPKDQKNCSFLCRWRVPCCNKSSCAPSLICMPPLLKVAARYYFLHKRSSFPSWCKFALSKFITLHFFHPLKEILFQSWIYINSKGSRQETEKRRRRFFGDTKQQARNNKRKSLGRCSASRSQGSRLNPWINRNSSSNHTNYTRAKRK